MFSDTISSLDAGYSDMAPPPVIHASECMTFTGVDSEELIGQYKLPSSVSSIGDRSLHSKRPSSGECL